MSPLNSPPRLPLQSLLLLLLSLLPSIYSQCHNLCSGNGVCNTHSQCTCNPGYAGVDCSIKSCPSGNAWADVPDANGIAHRQQECSGRGHCLEGTCICQEGFGGGACQIMKCNKDCNGHGQCMSMRETAYEYNGFSLNRSNSYNLWDADQIYGCVCDHGFNSYDCSEQVCDKGDDPRTNTGNDEAVKLYCQCQTTCSGSLVIRYKTNTLSLAHDATASQFADGLMGLAYSKSNSAVYDSTTPITVVLDAGSTVCSNGGTTSTVTFKKESGALPAMDIMVNQLSSGGGTPNAHFSSTQILTCTCAGACGGSFTLELDHVTTADLPFSSNAAALSTSLTNLHGSINKRLTKNIVTVTQAGQVCQDGATTTTTIEFKADSGNLPALGLISSLTDGGSVPAASQLSLSYAQRGSKESVLCNGIGTCNFELGKCDCGNYYTFEDAYGGCGAPVINTSAWAGVETCPGVVLQSTPDMFIDKPSSQPRLYFAQNTNASKTGLHYYATKGEFDLPPQLVANMTNMTAGDVAVDLSEGFVYFVDMVDKTIKRAGLYNVSKATPNEHPYSGDNEFTVSDFTASQGSQPSHIALDLRWHKRYMYWTLPLETKFGYVLGGRTDNTWSGQIKRCPLDKGNSFHCVEEDLTATIEAQVGNLNNPRGIALDLNNEKMYWVDSGNETVADGKVYMSNLDGTSASVLISKNLTDPYGIALDLVNSHMYIGERRDQGNNYGAVGRAPLGNNTINWIIRRINEGSTPHTRISKPDYLALDLDDNKIIFTDTGRRKIYWADRVQYWKTSGIYTGAHSTSSPQGIAFDHGHGYPDAGTKYYDCFGHGTCGGFASNFQCTCNDGWYGNCNMSTCPLGHAWHDEAIVDNQAHRMAECSNRGKCIEKSQECECQLGFSGAACERLDCPSILDEETSEYHECNGKGVCVTMEMMAWGRRDSLGEPAPVEYSYHAQTNKTNDQLWDAQMLTSCQCDTYWYENGLWTNNASDPHGYDCTKLTCPTGDNPNRPKANVTNYEENERQSLKCTANAGTFRLQFKGFYSRWLDWDVNAVELERQLQATKSFGNISVSYSIGGRNSGFCTSGGTNLANITFYSELGNQPTIKHDTSRLAGGTIQILEKQAGTKSNMLCSGQGLCDSATGECQCFTGYSSSDGGGNAGLRADCGYFGDSRSASWTEVAWHGNQ